MHAPAGGTGSISPSAALAYAGAVGCSDRGHTAVSQLAAGDIDWEQIFGAEGARWFHCGGIFAALSESTSAVAAEAMTAARRHGTAVSYDLNYRPSLWSAIGGSAKAQEVNRALAPLVDVLLGDEEDFTAALGFEIEGLDANLSELDPARFGTMMAEVCAAYPDVALAATTLRTVRSASVNDWGAASGPMPGCTSRRCAPDWRSWTASAGATRSRPGSSGCSPSLTSRRR